MNERFYSPEWTYLVGRAVQRELRWEPLGLGTVGRDERPGVAELEDDAEPVLPLQVLDVREGGRVFDDDACVRDGAPASMSFLCGVGNRW